MTPLATLQAIQAGVRDLLDADPICHPFQVPAALAGLYATGCCSPSQVYDYLTLFARALGDISDEVEAEELPSHLCAMFGISLARISERAAQAFSNPANSAKRFA